MANGTTLGADNGIGVAQILNLLDEDNDLSIEAIFTVDEEVSMKGAEMIDTIVELIKEEAIIIDYLKSMEKKVQKNS